MDKKEDIDKIKSDLIGRSTVKRRAAAKKLIKSPKNEYCSLLLDALIIEQGKGHWQTEVALIKALGLSKCVSASDTLRSITFKKDIEFSLVMLYAAEAYVRVTREDIKDVRQIISILDNCSYSAKEGALQALGYDKMLPDIQDLLFIIEKCRSFGSERPKGFTDPRYGLAAVCSTYCDNHVVNSFLKECLESKDQPLIYVAKNALKGNFVNLR